MKRIILYGVIVFQVLLIISLVRGVQLSLKSRGRITSLEEKKKELEAKAEELKLQEEYVQSAYYLEKVAREELHLARPGETVVIVPDRVIAGTGNGNQETVISREKPNWQKWWDILRGQNER